MARSSAVSLRRLTSFALFSALFALPAVARGEGRRLLADEVVAAVAAHTITLSEVRAEARITLLELHGPTAAQLSPDRPLLAATLQRMIDQRIVLTEVDSLRSFELDRAEIEAALIKFRARFGSLAGYEA